MQKTILVVDDYPMNRFILNSILHDEYHILEANDGVAALEIIQREYAKLSAILLDIVMPEMDGYEVLRQVRSNDATSGIPVIMVASTEDGEAERKSLAMGATDFVVKPFIPDAIKNCVKSNIALYEMANP